MAKVEIFDLAAAIIQKDLHESYFDDIIFYNYYVLI